MFTIQASRGLKHNFLRVTKVASQGAFIKMFTLICVLGIVNCSLTWEKKNIGDENYYRTYLPRWIQMMNRLAARGLLSVSSVQQYEQFLSTIRPLIDESDV